MPANSALAAFSNRSAGAPARQTRIDIEQVQAGDSRAGSHTTGVRTSGAGKRFRSPDRGRERKRRIRRLFLSVRGLVPLQAPNLNGGAMR